MGPGRWDAEALGQELGCSVRTVRRILQTLNESGIPCRYNPELKAYRVPRGFKFPGLDSNAAKETTLADAASTALVARRLLIDLDKTAESLKALLIALDK